jgi:hypothetical protein
MQQLKEWRYIPLLVIPIFGLIFYIFSPSTPQKREKEIIKDEKPIERSTNLTPEIEEQRKTFIERRERFEKRRELNRESVEKIKRGRDLTRNSIRLKLQQRESFLKLEKERAFRRSMIEKTIKRREENERE